MIILLSLHAMYQFRGAPMSNIGKDIFTCIPHNLVCIEENQNCFHSHEDASHRKLIISTTLKR